MRPSDLARYAMWTAVAATAARNRREYRVPTAWLTHLVANSVTLLLPDVLRMLPDPASPLVTPFVRTLRHRALDDPRYALYVAPLALGFAASHPDYSIYHGALGRLSVLGFGLDSIPHATAAYGLARLVAETLPTLDQELPRSHPLDAYMRGAAANVDALSAAAVALVTLVWETGEWLAYRHELEATGRDASEINMQWSLPDSITDAAANGLGLLAAVAVRRHFLTQRRKGAKAN